MQKIEWHLGAMKKSVYTHVCVCCGVYGVWSVRSVRKQPVPGELSQRMNDSKKVERRTK